MIYTESESLLLATGLGLKEISKIIINSSDDTSLEKNIASFGGNCLKRYQIFKKYKEMVASGALKEPIIVVVAGLPGLGKTTIAREIATRFGIGNVIGGDAFRASLREFISKETNPEFFTSVYDSWKFFGSEPTKDAVVKGFVSQAKVMNQCMERIVADRGIRDGESMVVEYLHFLPSQISPEVLKNKSVITILLNITDISKHKERIMGRVTSTHLKGGAERLIEQLDKYRIMQEYECEEAKKYGIPIVENTIPEEVINEIMDIIINRVEVLIG